MSGCVNRSAPGGCSLLLPLQATRPLSLFFPMLARARCLEPFSPSLSPTVGWFLALGDSREHLPALFGPGTCDFCALSAFNLLKMADGVESLFCNSYRGWSVVGRGSLSDPCAHTYTHRDSDGPTMFSKEAFVSDKAPWSPLLQAVAQVLSTLQPHRKPCQLSTLLRVICEHNGPVGWYHLCILE